MRFRHYTNGKGIDGIEATGLIMPGDQGKVFAERASRRALAKVQAEERYGINPGRGRHYIEFDAEEHEIVESYNSVMKVSEISFAGIVDLSERNPVYVRRNS